MIDEGPDRVAMLSDLRAWTASLRADMAAMRDEISDRIDRLEGGLEKRLEDGLEKQLEGGLAKRLEDRLAKRLEDGLAKRLESGLEKRLEDRLAKRLEDGLEKRLDERFSERIAREGETTRRYFEIMVERVEASVKIVAEVNAHHAVVLDDHESRLKHIEKTR